MSDKSSIEWTDSSWNPIRAKGALGRHYCQRISDGCMNCYASTMNRRFHGEAYESVSADAYERSQQLIASGQIYLDERVLMDPLRWRAPRKIFVCSMVDLFGEWVPDEWIDQIFGVMALTPQHVYQVLTKRPKRMHTYVRRRGGQAYVEVDLSRIRPATPPVIVMLPIPNVWLGVSIESDRYAWRAKVLAETPAAVRFISAEPLLGPLPSLDLSGIRWCTVGGESGSGARPLDLDWVRGVRDQCRAAGSALFVKQLGSRWGRSSGSHDGKGGEMADWPDDLRIREFPEVGDAVHR